MGLMRVDSRPSVRWERCRVGGDGDEDVQGGDVVEVRDGERVVDGRTNPVVVSSDERGYYYRRHRPNAENVSGVRSAKRAATPGDSPQARHIIRSSFLTE